MNLLKGVVIAGLALGVAATASPQTAKKSKTKVSAAQSLIDMERQWGEVCVTHDTSVLQRILADDFLGTSPEGKLYTKSDDIERIAKSHTGKALSSHVNVIKVRFFGTVAVLHGSETCTRRLRDDKEEIETLIWTDTWLKRNGHWQIVAAQDMHAQPSK